VASRFPFELRHHGDRLTRHYTLEAAVAEMRRRIKLEKFQQALLRRCRGLSGPDDLPGFLESLGMAGPPPTTDPSATTPSGPTPPRPPPRAEGPSRGVHE